MRVYMLINVSTDGYTSNVRMGDINISVLCAWFTVEAAMQVLMLASINYVHMCMYVHVLIIRVHVHV